MKKLVSMLLALAMVLTLAGGAMAETKDYSGYTIRIYSNSNSTERVNWLLNAAKEAGFSISIDDNSVISGDNAAIQKANESKDGDIIFGLNETRWSQLVNGTYENLKVMDWTPSWADEVGKYVYPGKAYGLVVQNVLMLYRNDDKGTNGKALHFQHWSDIVDLVPSEQGRRHHQQQHQQRHAVRLHRSDQPRRRHFRGWLEDAVEVLRERLLHRRQLRL